MSRAKPHPSPALRIGVIGSATADGGALDAARAVGRAVARAQAVLVCGGLGGVMDAAARGASEDGGTVVGILPGDDARVASPGVTIPLPTGLGEARNTLVVKAADAVIAVAGEWGTLNEAAMCLKTGTPLVGVRDTLPAELPIQRIADPDAAVAVALDLALERRSR
jgi:hypothetical protein